MKTITERELDHAQKLIELRDMALRNVKIQKESSRSFWANEYPPAKRRYLHKAEISRMAAERIDKSLRKYLASLIKNESKLKYSYIYIKLKQ